jgi:PAS domain S-box-containing protein
MIVSGKDITESKKYEELLKESADQFQSYIENAPFGIFVCNEQGRYQDVNPKAAAILGFTREELLRMSIPEILPVESQEYGLRLFQKVTEEGRATGEFAYKTKDGHIGRWLLEAVRLSPKKFMAFVVDTTERNRLEQQLKNEREDQQIILDSIPAWIFYKDKENRFLRVNKAFCDVMGKSKELLEGVSLFDIFPKEQAEAYWKDDLEVIASKKPKINIIESMTSAKGTLWVQTDKIPFRDKDGIIKGIIGFSVDITVRKETEEKLKMYAQDLEKMNKLIIGRELKMVELKKENAQLSQKA